jgi:hypothetical protein
MFECCNDCYENKVFHACIRDAVHEPVKLEYELTSETPTTRMMCLGKLAT